MTPSGPLDLETLTRLTYLTQVGKEVRRYYKLVPATFFAREMAVAARQNERSGARREPGVPAPAP